MIAIEALWQPQVVISFLGKKSFAIFSENAIQADFVPFQRAWYHINMSRIFASDRLNRL